MPIKPSDAEGLFRRRLYLRRPAEVSGGILQ